MGLELTIPRSGCSTNRVSQMPLLLLYSLGHTNSGEGKNTEYAYQEARIIGEHLALWLLQEVIKSIDLKRARFKSCFHHILAVLSQVSYSTSLSPDFHISKICMIVLVL